MTDLREQLQAILRGRVCLVGVGHVGQGDDGVGVRLVEALAQCGVRNAECGMARIEGRDPKAEGDPKSEARTSAALNGTTDFGSRPSFGPRPSALGFDVVLAGTSPERHVGELRDGAYDTVLFLDAVEFGAAPGSVALFNSGEMLAKFPQVSTHRLSLGLLAQLIEANGRTRVWLLGVQPGSLAVGSSLSPAVKNTVGLLVELFRGTGNMPVDPAYDSGEAPDRPEACSTHEFMRKVPAGRVRGEHSALRVPHSAFPC